MKLLSLSIQGFGKFRNFTLDLSEGLNVIYGLNEAGKSTLHAFIEGMFYGFIDGTKKRKTYLHDHEKYAPRDTTAYQGSVTFTHENTKYRLERNFDKKKGFVKLYETKTGKDITHDYPFHPVRKEIDLAHFLDMPYTLFKNTLSIAQLDAKTDEEAGSELLRRLQNMKETQSETLSMSRAIAALEKQIEDIGSDRARTKPYAKALDKAEALKREYDQAFSAHEGTLEEKNRLDELRGEDGRLAEEKTSLTYALASLENTKKRRLYQHLKHLVHTLQTTLKTYSENAPALNVDTLLTLNNEYGESFETLEETKAQLFDKVSKLEGVDARLSSLNPMVEKTDFQHIEDDYSRLKTLRDMHSKSEVNLKEKTALKDEKKATFEQARDTLHKRVNTFTHKWPFVSMLTIAAAFAGYFAFDLSWAFWILIIPVATGAILFKRNRTQAARASEALNADDEAEAALKKEQASCDMAKDAIEKLLRKYSLEKEDDFDGLYYEAKSALSDQQEKVSLKKTIDSLVTPYNSLIKRFGLFTETPHLKVTFNALKEVKDTAREIYQTLQGRTFKAFEASIDFERDDVDINKKQDITDALDAIKETMHSHALERSRKEEAIKNKESHTRELSTIEYAMNDTKRQIAMYDKDKRILKKAIERLKMVQKDIEEHFAPIMNEHTKKYLKILTQANYTSIKIKKNLTFKALSKKTGQLEGESFFSKGTLDQIYIAMRLGILATLGKKAYPFFLDDAFAQFDKERLAGALELLNTLAKDRQVILFTCHGREQATLKTKGIPYKGHTLT